MPELAPDPIDEGSTGPCREHNGTDHYGPCSIGFADLMTLPPEPARKPDRSGCQHLTQRVQYVTVGNDGILLLLICEDPHCAWIDTHCEHVNNDWQPDQDHPDARLVCRLCGRDGT